MTLVCGNIVVIGKVTEKIYDGRTDELVRVRAEMQESSTEEGK